MTSRYLSPGGNAPVGYRARAGGEVTQLTSRATAVTLNKLCGQITVDDASLAAGAEVTFTVNNDLVEVGDVPVIALQDQGASGEIMAFVSDVAAGSFDITITNLHATTAATNFGIINFAIINATAE